MGQLLHELSEQTSTLVRQEVALAREPTMKAKAAGKGGWEEILTLDADDADDAEDLLTDTGVVHYDISRRTCCSESPPTALSHRSNSGEALPRTRGVQPLVSRGHHHRCIQILDIRERAPVLVSNDHLLEPGSTRSFDIPRSHRPGVPAGGSTSRPQAFLTWVIR